MFLPLMHGWYPFLSFLEFQTTFVCFMVLQIPKYIRAIDIGVSKKVVVYIYTQQLMPPKAL